MFPAALGPATLCILISWHFPHLLKCFPCVSKLGKKYLFSFLLPSCLRCLCWQGWVWSLPSAERSGRSQHDLCLFTAARCSRPRPVKLSESIERLIDLMSSGSGFNLMQTLHCQPFQDALMVKERCGSWSPNMWIYVWVSMGTSALSLVFVICRVWLLGKN